ncbi:MAG: inositol monophosphatase family protein [Cyclobacteriaceae bacterium]
MKLSSEILGYLQGEAVRAAAKGGRYIHSQQHEKIDVAHKSGMGSLATSVVTEVDYRSQEIILHELRKSIETYDLGLLTEENSDNYSRLSKEYFWCIDPLDGTLSFTEGKAGYAVSIALVSQKGIPVLGIIYDPIAKKIYCQSEDLNLQSTEDQSLHCYLDRSFQKHPQKELINAELQSFVTTTNLSGVHYHFGMGAVMNALHVARHEYAVYFKFPKTTPGGGSMWDFAATACLYNSSGLSATDIHGLPLKFADPETTFMHRRGVIFTRNEAIRDIIRSINVLISV